MKLKIEDVNPKSGPVLIIGVFFGSFTPIIKARTPSFPLANALILSDCQALSCPTPRVFDVLPPPLLGPMHP